MDNPKILIHAEEPAPLRDRLDETAPGLGVAICDSLPGLIAGLETHSPDVLYSVRFGAGVYPRDAVLAEGGPVWIANGGVGIDHLREWNTNRVTVTNAAGVAAGMMAEYIIGAMLHFLLDMPGLQADQSAKVWNPVRMVRPLAGKTILIVGLGQTGQALAARAKAFGMHVIGTRARPAPMENVDDVAAASDLISLLPQADIVAVCTPLIPATRGLIDAKAFAAMKPGALLANVSRGGIVVEEALREALESGHLAGAAMDVFEAEPLPQDSPMWTVPNLLISPHCSAVYEGWLMASFEIFLDNLERFRNGQPMRNVVDPNRGY